MRVNLDNQAKTMNKLFINLLITALLMVGLNGCQFFQKHERHGVAAELLGQQLLSADLDFMTRQSITAEDSSQVAERFIKQWAMDILVYDQATKGTDPAIEQMVEDYRRQLYLHKYEQDLIMHHMNNQVADSVIEHMYYANEDQYILREGILQGLIIVLPNGTPKMDKLRRWLDDVDEDNLERIEKYAYQYGSGYELFLNEWKTTNQILMNIPMERSELMAELHKKDIIETRDSVNTYLLRVTRYHSAGEHMPLNMARSQIQEHILTWRQVHFLQEQREKLYEEAIRTKKLKIYETNTSDDNDTLE